MYRISSGLLRKRGEVKLVFLGTKAVAVDTHLVMNFRVR